MNPLHRFTVSSTPLLLTGLLLFLGSGVARAIDSGAGVKASRPRPALGRAVESVRAGTLVAPDGQVAVTSIDRKWDQPTGTGTLNEAAVTPDGRVSSREANLTRQPDGTIVTKGTFTDFDEQCYNFTETSRRTGDGVIVVGRRVDEEGRLSTYEITMTKVAPDQTRRTTVITRPDGAQETRVELLAPRRVTPLASR